MSNVITLHGDKRWKAVVEYSTDQGPERIEHYFEEISDLHFIIEHGPDWNFLIRCTVTLNLRTTARNKTAWRRPCERSVPYDGCRGFKTSRQCSGCRSGRELNRTSGRPKSISSLITLVRAGGKVACRPGGANRRNDNRVDGSVFLPKGESFIAGHS